MSLFRVTCLFFICIGCSKQINDDCDINEVQLSDFYTFKIGVAVNENQLNSNQDYFGIVNSHFNSLTSENGFKPMHLHPELNQFNWAKADQLIDFAILTNKRIHGHTLIWYNQLPNWMDNFNGDQSEWEAMLKNHIQTIVSHFNGKVESWDVLNEAFEDDGKLRENIWLKNIGESYIEKAFQYAAEADSSVLLFYNDYSIAANSTKREAILNKMNEIRSNGVKVDGIGMQMHINYNYPSDNSIKKAINDIVKGDYLVHISELDISINPSGSEMKNASERKLNKQAKKVKFIFDTFQSIPKSNQYGITFWGVSDRDSWLRSFYSRDEYPLLFNDDYQVKSAFCVLVN